ncbi:triphosphoribosyl-dephospho-CoA synthase [Methylopila sp. 73B]|uniref:triphosphoribosyl-dephospho-CoA synthase n=1 Tax=Methylopila sp. 73B TaxID=1120792 RepID=UPI00036892D8|nr:triphosphoribosyl-dephospho-CoA synthase [Methylopila sp. 73B]
MDARESGHDGEDGGARPAHLADLAVAALAAEAELTPKPGLVDRRGAGSHADMELDTLLASAAALRPTFAALAHAAEGERPSQALREALARIGRDGETAMFAATGGVNTHRGAIFALGLIMAAAAIEGWDAAAADICATAGAIARFADGAAPVAVLNGAVACRTYGVGGARGEAAAGFPHALKALEAVRDARARGATETAARLDGLMAAMAGLDDTCLLHRGGRRALRVARLGARAVIASDGAATADGRAALRALDRRLLALNASPGGSADMLAAALLLDALDASRHPGRSRAESRDRLRDQAPPPDDDPGSARLTPLVRDDDADREA